MAVPKFAVEEDGDLSHFVAGVGPTEHGSRMATEADAGLSKQEHSRTL